MFTGRALRRMFRRNPQKHNRLRLNQRWGKTRLLLQPLEERAVPAALYIVSGIDDIGNADDLRANVALANADPGSTIGFDSTVFTSASTITLASALTVSTDMTITGADVGGAASIALSGGDAVNIFTFNTANLLTVDKITLTKGKSTTGGIGGGGAAITVTDPNASITFTNAVVSGNTSTVQGGVIGLPDLSGSVITVTNSTFSGNRAAEGGVFYFYKTGTLIISGSTFTGNTATGGQGGVGYLFNGAATITNSSFTSNSASSNGGVFWQSASSATLNLEITGSTFTSNKASGTGGVVNIGGNATISNSTFTTNQATSTGGVFNHSNTSVTLTITGATFTNNSSGSTGGAISSTSSMTIDSSTFSGNTGTTGGAINTTTSAATLSITNSNFSGNTATTGTGGAIRAASTAGFTITNTKFTGNSAGSSSGGGAIYSSGHMNAATVTFTGNRASSSIGVGGAIRGTVGNQTISYADFDGNAAGSTTGGVGGAIHATSGTITVNSSTFRNNSAGGNGGAISASTTFNIFNSTFTKNTAAGLGGGGAIVTSTASPVLIANSTIYDNTASSTPTTNGGGGVLRTALTPLTINSTIIAANKRLGAGTNNVDIYTSTTTFALVAGDNIIGTTAGTLGFTISGSNYQVGDPAPGALGDNGGVLLPDGNKIKTMSVGPTSIASDAGNNSSSLSFDQRGTGFNRVIGGIADVGAYEGASFRPQVSLISAPDHNSPNNSDYTVSVSYIDAESNIDTTTIDTNDLTITGAGLAAVTAKSASITFNGGQTVNVEYVFAAPAGGWGNNGNIGSYTISMAKNQVADSDTPPYSVGAQAIGTFKTNFAVSLVVSEATDVVDTSFGSGFLSFREALGLANLNAGFVDSITFDTTVFNAAMTITLTGGAAAITDSVVVTGPAASLTYDANKTNQRVTVADNTTVTFSKLNFSQFSAAAAGGMVAIGSNASVTLSDMTFSKNTTSSVGGGAIAITGTNSTLTLNTVTFDKNTATSGGGAIYANGTGNFINVAGSTFTGNTSNSAGGAIRGAGTTTLVVTNSTFTGNTSSGTGGGAVYTAANSNVNISSTTFTSNTASAGGGAIYVTSGATTLNFDVFDGNKGGTAGAVYTSGLQTMNIDASKFTNNTGTSAGVFYNSNSTTTWTIDRSMFSGNTASRGVMYFTLGGSATISNSTFTKNTGSGNGGVIGSWSASLTVNSSTFYDNTAGTNGGAIAMISTSSAATLNVTNSTIVNNTATAGAGGLWSASTAKLDMITLSSTIVGGNKGTTSDDINTAVGGTISGDHNLVGVQGANWTMGGTPNKIGATSTQIGVNALANNTGFQLLDGSYVQTAGLSAVSLARDNGLANGNTYDQRGVGHPRTVGTDTDIGAFEANANPVPTVTAVADDVSSPGGTTFDVTVTFKDDAGIQVSTIDVNDVVVKTAIGGVTLNAKSFNASPNSGVATPVTVTFTFDAPDNVTTDTWDASDTDLYQVWFTGTVSDDDNPDNDVLAPQMLDTFIANLGAKALVVDVATDVDNGIYTTGDLSLREAVTFSNLNSSQVDSITFNLTSGTTITLASGFNITDSVNITGLGKTSLTIEADKKGRHFTVTDDDTLTLSSMTLTGGSATEGSAIQLGNSSLSVGAPAAILSNMLIQNGLSSAAVYLTSQGAKLNVDSSTFTNNSATTAGGAIRVQPSAYVGEFKILNSTFSGNTSSGAGGAIYFNFDGTGTIEASTFNNNQASNGGAISIDNAQLTITNSTFTNNTVTTGSGGALRMASTGSSFTIYNSTIANNTAGATTQGLGGGISRGSASAGQLILHSTIVAGNTAHSTVTINGQDIHNITSDVPHVVGGDYNLIGVSGNSNIDLTGQSFTLVDVDAKLDPLANNGGPTQTMKLQGNSPAIDSGYNPLALQYDQRGIGFPRDVNFTDIGAYEAVVGDQPTAKLVATSVNAGGNASQTFDIIYKDDAGIDSTTFGTSDVTVYGNGFGAGQNPVSITNIAGAGNSYTVTYNIPAPTGGWGGINIGSYTVSMNLNEVGDTDDAMFVAAGALGTFKTNFATSIEVDEATDVVDSNVGNNQVSFREAFDAISGVGGAFTHTITFDSTQFSGTPIVMSNVFTVTKDIVITGPSNKGLVVFSGNDVKQLFNITTAASVTMSGLTLQDGRAANGGNIGMTTQTLTLSNMNILSGSATSNGGGIYLTTGTLNLTNVKMEGNQATTSGGAIYSSSTVTINVVDSILNANTAGSTGGAIYLYAGTLAIDPSILSNNRATNGAAIWTGGSSTVPVAVTIDQTRVTGNVATSSHGAIYMNWTGTLTITDSTFDNNTAASTGGAIASYQAAVDIKNSTFTKNMGTSGGAIVQVSSNSSITIKNSTISDNTGTTGVGGVSMTTASVPLDVSSSIIADNVGATTPDIMTPAAYTIAGTNNFIGVQHANWTMPGVPNQIGVGSADLGALADNGGFTLPDGSKIPTMLPDPLSAVVDAGTDNGITLDQRGTGFPRSNGGFTDVGAIQAFRGPIPIGKAVANNVTIGGGTTFDVTVTFKDDKGVDVSSIQASDFAVKTVFGSNTYTTTTISINPGSGVVSPVTVTLTFDAPGGTWDAPDTNIYEVYVTGTISDDDNPDNNVDTTKSLGQFYTLLGSFNLTVDKLGDVDDGNYKTGELTLREATNISNVNGANVDTIGFNLANGSTITLDGELHYTDGVTINGPGSGKLTVDGNGKGRIFNFNDNSTITHSNVSVSGLKLTGGKAGGDGGAIYDQDENLTLSDMFLTGNTANVVAGDGGGLNVEGSGAQITISDTTFTANRAGTGASGDADGGAMDFEGDSSVSINRVLVDGNFSTDDAGGIAFHHNPLNTTRVVSITNSAIVNNAQTFATGGHGGGINFGGQFGSLTIRNSTISGNTTQQQGGGIQFYNVDNNVLIQNTTVTNNKALTGGGLDFTDTGTASTTSSGTIEIQSSIISKNSAGTGNDLWSGAANIKVNRSALGLYVAPTFTDDAPGFSFLANQDMKLAPLAGNGSTLLNHRISSSSPAKDAGYNPTPTIAFDQRGTGFPRELGATVDMGAYEVDPNIPSADAILTPISLPGGTTYTFTVTFADDTGIKVAGVKSDTLLTVTGPNGFSDTIDYIAGSIDVDSDGTPRTASYQFTPPGGAWNSIDNGTYTISIAGNAVEDTDDSLFVPGGSIGTFNVAVPFLVEVDNLGDIDNGIYTANDLTLREAIDLANKSSSTFNLVTFKPSLFVTAQTITMLGTAMQIKNHVEIQGPGANLLTVDAAKLSQVFIIDDTVVADVKEVKISGMTITGGTTTTDGGAIFVDENLTLDGVHVKNNTAGSDGGGIYFNNGRTFNLLNSAITGNTSSGTFGGGGIYMTATNVVLISNSTLSGNSSAGEGGAFCGFAWTASSPFNIKNSTFTGNTGANGGGAIRITSGTITLDSTIVYGNSANSGGPDYEFVSTLNAKNSMSGSTVSVTNYNDQGGSSVGVDPLLGALTDNGGAVPTHAIALNSPAINKGSNPDGLTVDSRGAGFARVAGSAADVGSYERQLGKISSIVFGDGSAQRSMVTQMVVTFTDTMTFSGAVADAFTLFRNGVNSSQPGGSGNVTLSTTAVSPTNTVTITFSGPFTTNGSLIDGFYDITIDASKISTTVGAFDGNGDGTGGDNFTATGNTTNKYFRIFGDRGGNGVVGLDDFAAFKTVFNVNFDAAFDYDNNLGNTGLSDFAEFKKRFNFTP